jgi:hypothetical protein
LFQRLREAAQAVPGVASVSMSVVTPLGRSRWNTVVENSTHGPALPPRQRLAWVNILSPGWFKTYGIHVLQGRDVSDADRPGAPRVVVVNEAFVRKYMPEPNPVDQMVYAGLDGLDAMPVTVVGVVSDAVYRSARGGFEPTIYAPLAQLTEKLSGAQLTIEAASGHPAPLKPAIAAALEAVDPDASYTFNTIDQQLRDSVRQERLVAMLSGFFGVLALLLAGLGLYGVTSYAVNRRRAEIAIRMALGASARGDRHWRQRVGGQVDRIVAVQSSAARSDDDRRRRAGAPRGRRRGRVATGTTGVESRSDNCAEVTNCLIAEAQ